MFISTRDTESLRTCLQGDVQLSYKVPEHARCAQITVRKQYTEKTVLFDTVLPLERLCVQHLLYKN